MLRFARHVLFVIFAVGAATLAFSQGITTGTVAGVVADPSGAVVPAAQVQLTNKANGLKLVQQSNSTGGFTFFAVPIGTYDALITANGFASQKVANIRVVAGATTNLNNVQLSVGTGAGEQVEVNGSAAVLLETTDSQVTTTFSTEMVQNLPLNNGFDTIAEVIPGVVGTGDDNFSNANGDNYSVNGQSGRYNNFEIDGQSNNDNSIGGSQYFFGSQEAIQQIQVITNDYSAQYGRNAGAVVNYITKSGTNNFHGSVFNLYQSQFLSSLTNSEKNPLFGFCPPGVSSSPTNPCGVPTLPRYVENRPGATLGGPIVKDKLFFFYSTFWDRVRPGVAPSQSLPALTPDPTGLATIKTAFAGDPGAAAIEAFGPYSIAQGNPQPIPGTTTIQPMTDAMGRKANVEVAGVQRTIASIFDDHEELGRIDWQPTSKDRLFARYMYQSQMSTGNSALYTAAGGDFFNILAATHSVGADWTHTFSPRLVDQLRYSFQQAKSAFEGGAYPNCVTTNVATCPATVDFFDPNVSPFGGDVIAPQGRTVKVTQVQNNATWIHGVQTLVFGGEFDYQNSPNEGLFYYEGFANYSELSNFLGTPDPALGGATAELLLVNGSFVIPFTEPDVAAYFQDDWKALPTLTVHLGVRWEFFGQALNKLNQQTFAREINPGTAFWSTSLPLADRIFPSAKQVYKNFEPRIGLAWNPEFDRKFVVRAGYAINANPAFYNMMLIAAGNAPAANFGAIFCGSNACLPSNGSLLTPDYRAFNLPFLPCCDPRAELESPFAPRFRTPYVQTYTLGLDHQLGNAAVAEVRYVGAKTTDDFQSINANPFLLPVATAFPNFVASSSLCQDKSANGFGRPDCNYSNVSEFTNGSWAVYQGLQLNVTTQNYHGLTSIWSYTRSKSLNNATDAFRTTGAGGSTLAYSQNPLDTNVAERGLSGNDFPNIIGVGATYNLPKFAKDKSMLGRLANGFLLSTFYRYRSGQVYTPVQALTLDSNTGDSSFCDFGFNAQNSGLDTCRPVLSNKKAPANSVAYLNPFVDGGTPFSPVPGTPKFVVYGSDGFDPNTGVYNQGTPVDPSSTRWIVNNQAYALRVGNPYPGSSRSIFRSQPYGDLDVSLAKTFPITERIGMQLSMAAYNALNQMYRGSVDAPIAASDFASNILKTSGSVPGDTSGNRFVILGGKVIF